MVRCVLFDLDETLSNRTQLVKRLIEDQHARFDQSLSEIPKDEFLTRFEELEQHGYVPKNEVYAQMVKELGLSSDLAFELFADFRAHYASFAVAFPNLTEMLTSLKGLGLKMAILTNGATSQQMGVIQTLGIEGYFGEILVSEREGIKKPDPIFFQRALDRLNVAPEEAVMVGDHPEVDVRGAKAVGIKAIWKSVPYYQQPEEADAVCMDLGELPELIAKWTHGIVAASLKEHP